MSINVNRSWLVLPLLLGVLACDQSPVNSPTSPSATTTSPSPSPTPAPSPAPTPSTSTITGTVVTAAASGIGRAAADLPAMVTVIGTNVSSAIAPNGSFMLTGAPAGEPRLRFTGSGIDATLKLAGVQPGQVLTIIVLVTGTTAVLQETHPGENKVELEGLIDAIQPASRSFTLQGRTVRVTDATEIRHGDRRLAFSDLHVGDRVHVRGTPESTIVVASLILLQNPGGPGPNPQPEAQEVKVRGTIAAIAGTCPSRAFTIGSQPVVTSASTRFDHTSCADLQNGQMVQVEGTRQTDGSVLAREIEREEAEEAEAEVEGAVSSLAGTCPSLTFLVSSRRVVTNSATRFDKIACGDLRNGFRVEVKGTRQSDGAILASRVKRED